MPEYNPATQLWEQVTPDHMIKGHDRHIMENIYNVDCLQCVGHEPVSPTVTFKVVKRENVQPH